MDKDIRQRIIPIYEDFEVKIIICLKEYRYHLKRLNWSKEDAKQYLLFKYGKSSLLTMNDLDIAKLLYWLDNLPDGTPIPKQTSKPIMFNSLKLSLQQGRKTAW
jgi:hypothetical protein